VDRKPPALDPAITLASLTLVEGTPLVLKWNKPLTAAEATYEGKAILLTLSADGLTAPLALDPAVLKEAPTPIKLKATDKAGNTFTSDGVLTFKRKPAQPIALTASHAGAEWITNVPTDLKLSADRDVEKWEVLLDGQPATERFLPKPASEQKAKVLKDITLGAAALLALPDGDHPIVVKASDSFGTVSEYKLVLRLDRKPPVPTAKNSKDGAVVALPAVGEPVQLVELGTHCKGAIFLDGADVVTDALTEVIDGIAQRYDGFYFGRFDVRVPSRQDLMAGRNFRVVELNGVTSEATHIYDPKLTIWQAYRTLFEQWRIAFEIGDQNRARGVKPMPPLELLSLIPHYRKLSKGYPE